MITPRPTRMRSIDRMSRSADICSSLLILQNNILVVPATAASIAGKVAIPVRASTAVIVGPVTL